MSDMRVIDCPACGGNGGVEDPPYRDGTPGQSWQCLACNGTGECEAETKLVTRDDDLAEAF